MRSAFKDKEKRKGKDKCTHIEEAPTDVNHWKLPDAEKAPAEIEKALANVGGLFWGIKDTL